MAGQYKFKDTNGNVVSSISGSNTGVISFSGSLVDFSNTIISGTASNALLLDGFDSTAFVFTSSFNTISQSISSDLLNLKSKSSSVDISISNINQFTASNGNTSLNSYTASNDTKFTTLGSYTGSNDTKWTSISNVTSSLIQVTGSYATTGSNTFKGTQIVSASMYVQGDLVVYGSSSIQYISASSVSIGTNIVQLNTNQPAVRFGGLSVQDSGSAVGVTGSMFWDGCCNRWIYSNPSGVGYSGGVIMSGPRASTFGNEPTLTCNYIAKSGGGDHLYDSCIIDDGTTTCIKNDLIGTTAKFTDGTQGLNIRPFFGCAGYGSLYASTLTPSATNHAFAASCTNTVINTPSATGKIYFDNLANDLGAWSTTGLGIGTVSPSSPLEICSTTVGLLTKYTACGNDTQIRFYNTSTGGGIFSLGVGGTSSGAGAGFYVYQESCNTVRFKIDNSGNTCLFNQLSTGPYITIGNQGGTDTTVIGGGSGAGSQIRMNYAGGSYNNFLAGNGDNYFNCLLGKLNAAGGVKFASGASTLGYYEEGGWYPQLYWSAGGAWNMNGANCGRYTRVGNMVTLQFQMMWGSYNGGTTGGTLRVSGIPYSNNSVSRSAGSITAIASNALALDSGYTWLGLTIDPGASFIYVIENASAGGYSHTPQVGTSGTIYSLSITYTV